MPAAPRIAKHCLPTLTCHHASLPPPPPSPHVITGMAGLALLSVQSLLPLAFASGTGEARTAVGGGCCAQGCVASVASGVGDARRW